MFRSLTDAQLGYRHDHRAWVDEQGQRHMFLAGIAMGMRFDPRPECIPSRDPLPFRDPGGFGHRRYASRTFAALEWAPRAMFARPPVNRILTHFRKMRVDARVPLGRHAAGWMDSLNAMFAAGLYTSAEIEHARKVLERLAALT